MKILFLHGWQSVPGGVKPTFLKDRGHEVVNPKLPDDDFPEAVRIAQAEFDRHRPRVVVGSSRGGAVAMTIDSGDARLVLLCPAWRKYGTAQAARPDAVILHSRADDVVPFADSEALARDSGATLIEVGRDHRLADPEPLEAMLEACLADEADEPADRTGCAPAGTTMKLTSYLSPKTGVRPSGIAGRGLYATAPLARGEIVSVKGGHLIDGATRERHKAVINDADMQIADDLFLAPLAADEFEGVMMFLNHSCEPTVGVQGQIVFVALRDVAAGEELTLDYGTIDHDAEPMVCRCGAAACRGTITGEDWRRPDLQQKYGDHFAWHLLRRMRSEH